MIIYMGTKLTANQVAKALIADRGVIALDFWHESIGLELDNITQREQESIQNALDHQYNRLVKFFGIDSCGNKQ